MIDEKDHTMTRPDVAEGAEKRKGNCAADTLVMTDAREQKQPFDV